MSLQRRNGEPNIQNFQKKASTAFVRDTVVAWDVNGFLVPATAATDPQVIAGVIQVDVTAADPDYALPATVPVEVPRSRNDQFYATVLTGSASQALVGTRVDLADANSIDVTATAKKQVKVEMVIAAKKIVVTFPGFNAV